jgi:uncharacterized protein YecT (DUF1311 family)/Na+-transporting methylmalonyl-CoA/oxaloacetate decarboxylase gamma subunit
VKKNDVTQDQIENLADALTEDILNTPDDELLREVAEDYGDPRALANKFDQILERAEKQVFGMARPAASQVRSSVLNLPYRLLEWFSTLFGSGPGRSGTQFQFFSVNRMVWAGVAAVLIVLILAPAVFRSMSEFGERSRQLTAREKEQLAKSGQLAAQEKELLARSEQLAAREKELHAGFQPAQARQPAAYSPAPSRLEASPPIETQAAVPPAVQAPPSKPRILCNIFAGSEHLMCFDDDLIFWQNLVFAIYQHTWQQLDTNGQQILRQGQLDWVRNMLVDCDAAFTVPVSGTEMARAKSCVLQSTKERVAILSKN